MSSPPSGVQLLWCIAPLPARLEAPDHALELLLQPIGVRNALADRRAVSVNSRSVYNSCRHVTLNDLQEQIPSQGRIRRLITTPYVRQRHSVCRAVPRCTFTAAGSPRQSPRWSQPPDRHHLSPACPQLCAARRRRWMSSRHSRLAAHHRRTASHRRVKAGDGSSRCEPPGPMSHAEITPPGLHPRPHPPIRLPPRPPPRPRHRCLPRLRTRRRSPRPRPVLLLPLPVLLRVT